MSKKNLLQSEPATVLIVDDNEGNRLLLTAQLSEEGYQLLQATGADEALALLQEQVPDLILLDVVMPKMDGFEFCKILKQQTTTQLIPIILVTSLNEAEDRIAGIHAGADEFLSRPYLREELILRVRTLLRLKYTRLSLEEERKRLHLFHDMNRSINAHLDLNTMMSEILKQLQTALQATKGSVLLLDEAVRLLQRFTTQGKAAVEIRQSVNEEVLADGLAGWLIKHNRGKIINDVQQDKRWLKLSGHEGDSGSAIGVPLARADKIVGVLIFNHQQTDYFTEDHLTLLETACTQMTTAVENAYLFSEVSEERGKLGAVLLQSADAVVICNEAEQVTLFNPTAEQFFEVSADAVEAVNFVDIPQLQPLVPLIKQAATAATVKEIYLSNGRIGLANVSPIAGVGYAVVIHDITQLKQAEAARLDQERQEKERVKETFGRYMGPQLVEHVLSNEPGLMARREHRVAVVLFADLRNYTQGMITKLEPDKVVELLNMFFTKMMSIAVQNDGTVFELTGDEILVGFNAPFDQALAPLLALKTAVAMQHHFNRLRQDWFNILESKIGLGIGIDLGNVVVGNVGAESRMSFRMVGEVMSRAHRLVERAEDGQIVISQPIYRALQATDQGLGKRLGFRESQPVGLKGFSSPQILYVMNVARPVLRKTENTLQPVQHIEDVS